jgi:glucosamine--fructose-6-phosphate aminotransferase (isomerizing)
VYNKQLDLTGALVLVISQSGRSPDILAQVAMAKAAGALVVALVNDESSPLAEQADQVIPLNVGAEKAVAATKSYLATLSALLQLVAAWSGNSQLQDAVISLPELLQRAIELPAQLTALSLQGVEHLVVLGRGPGYAISREIALKLKEVCGIHAEAFSSAEFLHGPVTLVKDQFAIVDVSIADEANAAHQAQIAEVRSRGARIVHLHHADLLSNPRVLPLALLQRFYLDVEAVARSRGVNPDAPPGLNKVTKTV